jgi:hypothetical protein
MASWLEGSGAVAWVFVACLWWAGVVVLGASWLGSFGNTVASTAMWPSSFKLEIMKAW